MGKRKRKQAEAAAEAKAKLKKKRRGGLKPLLFVLLIGGAASLVLSESVRNKALDALFGSEQEFQYTPPAAPAPDASGDQS